MTERRPEHGAGYGGYEDPHAFGTTADGLADPLNDPLPGQRSDVPAPGYAAPSPAVQPAWETEDPAAEWSDGYYNQYAVEPQAPLPQVPPQPQPPQPQPPLPQATAPRPFPPDQQLPHVPPQPQPAPYPQPDPAPYPQPGPVPYPQYDPAAYAHHDHPQPSAEREPAPVPVPQPEPVSEPVSEPVPVRAPEPVPYEETIALRTAGLPAAEPPVQAPTPGGRAERRKAAARGGSRARRGPDGRAEGPAEASEPAKPLSRVEARAAARALKDSPGVIVSRAVGELFITFGVLMLLFVTYQLWWTNVSAGVYADKETNKIQDNWSKGSDEKGQQAGAFEPGQGFAIMHIPKLDVVVPIAEGISKGKVLDHGMVGHYSEGNLKTAMPSDKEGNFAVAGHRNTHGEPFRYINQLKPGDEVVVETQDAYYTYDMTSTLAQTPPSNVSVIEPVPPQSGFTKPGRYITLTTCTPEFTSTYRLIVWGKMVDERPRSKGMPDALVG
ncbi:class E sortase [Streptomyces sp. NPDC088725]|uniref:class E sortase n=1 Tax=Streptomyces sp. NPDC088725 TaxID=3365873 RepID=UPI00380EA497